MWKRELEPQNYRIRRITLIRQGLDHAQIDRLFAKELEAKEALDVAESQQQAEFERKKDLRARIAELIDKSEIENLSQNERIDAIVDLSEKAIEKRLKALNAVIDFYKKALEQIVRTLKETKQQYAQDYSELMKILKSEIALYMQAKKDTDKMYLHYVESAQKANDMVISLNKKYLELDKRITQYNDMQRRLRR